HAPRRLSPDGRAYPPERLPGHPGADEPDPAGGQRRVPGLRLPPRPVAGDGLPLLVVRSTPTTAPLRGGVVRADARAGPLAVRRGPGLSLGPRRLRPQGDRIPRGGRRPVAPRRRP